MTSHRKLGQSELFERYGSADVRTRIADLLDLRTFLQECIIRTDYKIPDELNEILQTTEYGTWLVKQAASLNRSPYPKINPKVARLTCFLEFYHLDFLIDIEATDVDALAGVISNELLAGHIMLPFVHGPGLYDRAAEMFPDEQPWLSTVDTLRLLEGQPIGVFQMGRWLSGPFGLMSVSWPRDIRPSLRVPLQHCHDVSCRQVHSTYLSTDSTAKINDSRSEIAKLLVAESEEPSEFAPFFADLAEHLTDEYDDTTLAGLGYLVADSLSDRELALVLVELIKRPDWGVRQRLNQIVGEFKAPESLVEGMTRAELLQLTFVNHDPEIAEVIDSLVFSGDLRVPEGEVRRPVLRAVRASAFGNVQELSRLGLRSATRQELGPLRLRRLVESIFLSPVESSDVKPEAMADVEDLSWQLREIKGVNVEARLDEYLRTESPDDVIRRLILSRQSNVATALKALKVNAHGVDDDTLVLRMLWKLGFDVSEPLTMHERFWRLHERMVHSARAANVSTIVDQESIRGLSANYFVALEYLLSDSLAFTSWVLTADHVTDRHPFTFDAASQVESGFRVLLDDDDDRSVASEGWTLRPLCDGFATLAAFLSEAAGDVSGPFDRARDDFPPFSGKTGLQHFPFKHSLAFLDLTVTSRKRILEILTRASAALVKSRVFEVRNEQLHFRRASSDVDKLITALSLVEAAVRDLEDAGFTRITFFPDRTERDRWGRSTIYFNDRRGREIALGRPSSYSWLNMPPLSEPQYLILAAQFAEPNEVLRIQLSADSEFRQMWERFPQRRRKSRTRLEDSQTGETAPAGLNPESLRA